MGFTQSVRTCLSKYVTFSGRAPRSEYWYFFLFIILLNLVASAIDWQVFTTTATLASADGSITTATSSQPVQSLLSLAIFLPHLAVAWRRMHDSGRSGLYALFPFLLILGAAAVMVFGIGMAGAFQHGGSLDVFLTRATLLIMIPTLLVLLISPLLMLWWLTRPSQPGTNAYGPNPHGVAS